VESFNVPLFPLSTVLYPGGRLPLKIFEQRYHDMCKRCISSMEGFGVVAAGVDEEQDRPFASIGTMAVIDEWDMPHPGIFHLQTSGAGRFLIEQSWREKDGLFMGKVRHLPAETDTTLTAAQGQLASLLEALMEKFGADKFPAPALLGSASWVGMRLAEVMPMSLKLRQQLLEINDPTLRLTALEKFLIQHNIRKESAD
jgi:uncharacterized protein